MSTAPKLTPSRSFSGKILAALVVVAIALIGWFTLRDSASPSEKPQATFTLLSGEKVALAQLQGKVTVVNFWATSCTTCVKEMPSMVQTYEKYHKQGLEFIAVAMKYDPPMYVMNFAESRKLPFKVAMDSDGSAAQAFQSVQLTPTTYVLDKRGQILKKYVGEPEWAEFHALLEKALGARV